MNLRDILCKRPIEPVKNLTEEAKTKKKTKTDENGPDTDVESKHDLVTETTTRKSDKFNRNDYKDYDLISIGYPSLNKQSATCKKKYSIPITFMKKDGDRHLKTKHVLFGSADGKDYVDHQNEEKRVLLCKRLVNHDENWAHPNYYRLYLLNSCETDLNKALLNLQKHHGIDIESLRRKDMELRNPTLHTPLPIAV